MTVFRWLLRWLPPCVGVLGMPFATARADVKSCLDAAEDGQKLRDAGAYRHARDQFISCASDECPGEVRKRCVGWLADLEKLMPTVVFRARSGGKEIADVRVLVDGEIIGERIDGKPVALDPGEHRMRFERAGSEAIDEAALIVAGEKERLLSVRFGPEPLVAVPSSSVARSSRSPYVYAIGGFGIVGFATGVALDVSGYVFLRQCAGDLSCSASHERAEVEWRFVAGDILVLTGVIAGVAAWVLWPRDSRAAPRQSSGSIGAACSRSGARLGLTFAF
jgi:hypothetical protein